MVATPYEAEERLQEMLESHPDLLAGSQMQPDAPRRWALIKREQGVPDGDQAGARWSVDHLFVDQDAVPTLVEVKRSTDTRIRREVVGQMLDYAANGIRYWPVEKLQLAFEATQQQLGHDPVETLAALCEDPGETPDAFFVRMGDNLKAGRIRMVFVADVIPDELMRITEFLNEQMSPAEVFAVEVKQYRAAGHDGIVVVPAVFGRTAAASTKSSGRRAVDRDVAWADSSQDTHRAVQLLSDLAEELDLVLTETPSGGTLAKTRSGGSVANVYLAPYDSLDVALNQLRSQGWTTEADSAFEAMSALTSKRLTAKNPAMPTADVVAGWHRLRPVLTEIARLHQLGAKPPTQPE